MVGIWLLYPTQEESREGSDDFQALQQQQRVERDAVLAELEESRILLIKRLRNHHGIEWEVVHEALAFAGEPVGEGDELPLPPYPMPLDARSPEMMDSPISMRGIRGPVKRLALVDSRDEGSGEQTAGNRCSDEDIVLKQAVKVRNGILGFQPFLAKFVGDLFGKGVGFTARVTMLAATVITIIFFANVQQQAIDRKSAKGSSKMNKISSKKPPISLGPINPLAQEEICPPGRVMKMQDGHPKCVVKERTEIPFHKEIKSPDVLYGRG